MNWIRTIGFVAFVVSVVISFVTMWVFNDEVRHTNLHPMIKLRNLFNGVVSQTIEHPILNNSNPFSDEDRQTNSSSISKEDTFSNEKDRQPNPRLMYKDGSRAKNIPLKKEESIPVYFYKKQSDIGDPFRNCELKCHLKDGHTNKPDAVVVLHSPSLRDAKPLKKYPGQLWVFYTMESPSYHPPSRKLFMWKNLVNWTLGYRRDSDIFHGYGTFLSWNNQDTTKDVTCTTIKESEWRSKFNKSVLFASHCGTASKRLLFIKALMPFYHTDIYGACGPLKCSKSKWAKCLDTIRDYKFYAAFENSLCKDYVTEKMFKTYKMNGSVIPVGRGQKQYGLFMPPNSYLDTSKYSSPKKLAEHMQYISNNARSNANFFAWKKHFYVAQNRGKQSGFCELCTRLHDPVLLQKHTRLYRDFDVWLRGRKGTEMCSEASDFL